MVKMTLNWAQRSLWSSKGWLKPFQRLQKAVQTSHSPLLQFTVPASQKEAPAQVCRPSFYIWYPVLGPTAQGMLLDGLALKLAGLHSWSHGTVTIREVLEV